MTKVQPPKPTSSPKFKITMPKAAPLHMCAMCGAHFSHLFAYNRHLLRQHWFEAQKDFSEEKLKTRVAGLTEKQSQKLRELYQKLKERNSPTPPKRSRRCRPVSDMESPYGGRGPRVANLKEYKLVTVDDMSEAYKDKYNNPGGYTIFHFKVPKKNGPAGSPPLTALKKTYSSSDNKTTHKTEKVPITTTAQLSSWQRKSFESHLSRGLSSRQHQITASSSRSSRGSSNTRVTASHASRMTSSYPRVTSSPNHVTSSSRGFHHAGCGKCSRRRKHSGSCENAECSSFPGSSVTYPQTVPLNFSSPLLNTNFNCTDILKKIIHSPESISKPVISLTVEDVEADVDVMSIDLAPSTSSLTPSPSSSYRSDESPCSSRDRPASDPAPLMDETTAVLAQIGLEMVYTHYFCPQGPASCSGSDT